MIEKTKRRSRGAQFIDKLAGDMATDPEVVAVIREAFQLAQAHMRQHMPIVARRLLKRNIREVAVGEEFRIYSEKIEHDQRDAQQERIRAALVAGESNSIIARRERVSERHIRRLRGRIGDGGRTD